MIHVCCERDLVVIRLWVRLCYGPLDSRSFPPDDTKNYTTNGEEVASAIMSLLRNCILAITFATQLAVVAELSRTAGGIWFFTLALVHPIICICYNSSNSSKRACTGLQILPRPILHCPQLTWPN